MGFTWLAALLTAHGVPAWIKLPLNCWPELHKLPDQSRVSFVQTHSHYARRPRGKQGDFLTVGNPVGACSLSGTHPLRLCGYGGRQQSIHPFWPGPSRWERCRRRLPTESSAGPLQEGRCATPAPSCSSAKSPHPSPKTGTAPRPSSQKNLLQIFLLRAHSIASLAQRKLDLLLRAPDLQSA
jgi:hypothetical protein